MKIHELCRTIDQAASINQSFVPVRRLPWTNKLIKMKRCDVCDVSDLTQAISRAPLPSFSALVLQHIDGKGAVPEKVWSLMISEAAHYYIGRWPDINDHQHYQAIGVKMYAKYPAIGLTGASPWVCCTCIVR